MAEPPQRSADPQVALETTRAALLESDPQQQRDRRMLRAEASAVRRRIAEIGRQDAHGVLVELGLLPK